MLQDWFWGTVLSKETAEYRWLPTFSEVDESCDSVDLQEEGHHKTLELTMAVLGPEATEGEVQEIELVTKDSREADIAVTIAVLVGGSLYQQLLKVELPQVPATLRLKRGEGPVHIIGKEYVDRDIDPDDDQEAEEEEELEEEEPVVDAPAQKIDAKKRKKPETNGKSANGSSKAKRTKVDAKAGTSEDDDDEEDVEDEEDMDESDDESEEEAPPPRGKKAKKGAAAAAEPAASKRQAAAGKKMGGSAKKARKGAKGKA